MVGRAGYRGPQRRDRGQTTFFSDDDCQRCLALMGHWCQRVGFRCGFLSESVAAEGAEFGRLRDRRSKVSADLPWQDTVITSCWLVGAAKGERS